MFLLGTRPIQVGMRTFPVKDRTFKWHERIVWP